jgi:translation elongation factor EF-Ts
LSEKTNCTLLFNQDNVSELREKTNCGLLLNQDNVSELREKTNCGLLLNQDNVSELLNSDTLSSFNNSPQLVFSLLSSDTLS